MLFVLSPAKTLDFESPLPSIEATEARFLNESKALIQRLRRCSAKDLAERMSISPALAELNHGRYRDWQPEHGPDAARPCVLAFAGDVYEGLDAPSLDLASLNWCQQHLRILSGLYGVLRPLDRIRPYRLEMGTRLDTRRGHDLYSFWGDRLSRTLISDLDGHAEKALINLASVEYFKAVPLKRQAQPARLIQPVFQGQRDEGFKIISFMAKRARGLMARYAIDQRIDRPEGLLDFDLEGYRYDARASDDTQWVFRRAA